jgi:hypothetical protein
MTPNDACSGPDPPAFQPDTNRWAWIPPGTFTMGSPDGEPHRYDSEGPQTQVTITRGFWMGRYEVPQGEYQAVTGSNPSFFGDDLNLPVELVSWYDATNYCVQHRRQRREFNGGRRAAADSLQQSAMLAQQAAQLCALQALRSPEFSPHEATLLAPADRC